MIFLMLILPISLETNYSVCISSIIMFILYFIIYAANEHKLYTKIHRASKYIAFEARYYTRAIFTSQQI